MNNTKIEIRVKSSDHYERKVYCLQCRARLMDIHAADLEYRAVLKQISTQMAFDFSMKCPKCRSVVGISFDRTAPQVSNEVACSDPVLYRVILLGDEVGA